MLELIINHINQQLATLDTFEKILGLCEKITDTKGETRSFPAEYCTKDNYDSIDLDYSKGVVYHRLIGSVTNADSEDNAVSACDVLQTITYPMRLVASVSKAILDLVNDNEFIEDKIAQNIQNVLTLVNSSTLATSLKADSVMISVGDKNLDRYSVWDDEYTNIKMAANFDQIYISVDYEIEITGTNTCFENAGCDPLTLLCDISKVSNDNLTDPDIGLTTSQLCSPVLGLYDFSLQSVLDCLSEQQEIDLGIFTDVYTHNNGGGFNIDLTIGGGLTYDIDWGDGSDTETLGTGLQSHLYTGAVTRTIRMKRNLDQITSMDLCDQDLLSVKLEAFTMLGGAFLMDTNPGLTSVSFPTSSEPFTNFSLHSCDITGTLDVSNLTGWGGIINISLNSNMTRIDVPTSSVLITDFRTNDSGLVNLNLSTVNLSGFFDTGDCPALASITMPVTSNVFTNWEANTCLLVGTLDLSMLTGLAGVFNCAINSGLMNISLPATAGVFTNFSAQGCDLGYTNFTPFSGDNSNIIIIIDDNNMTTAEVNHLLVDLDNTGWINGNIDMNGTNAAPDGGSGGFNGTAAKAALIVDGWTVTTN